MYIKICRGKVLYKLKILFAVNSKKNNIKIHIIYYIICIQIIIYIIYLKLIMG